MTPPAVRRPAWPLTGGDGVPSDTPKGHVANILGALRMDRQLNGWGLLPDRVRVLLVSAERRMTLALEGLELVEADWTGPLELVPGCACVRRKDGLVVLPCFTHDTREAGT